MKHITIIAIIFLYACNSEGIIKQQTSQKEVEPTSPIIDTIPELNTLVNLDSSIHQFFIDTTKNSRYYNQIKNWKPNKFDIQGANFYYNEILKNHKPANKPIKNFPRKFTAVHQFENQLLSFNPINGIDHRFSITDTSIIHYRIEADCDLINKVVKETKNELILELRTIPQKRENQIEFLQIKKTSIPYIYQVSSSATNSFETNHFQNIFIDIDSLSKINMLVDDAPFLVHHTIKFQTVDEKRFTTHR